MRRPAHLRSQGSTVNEVWTATSNWRVRLTASARRASPILRGRWTSSRTSSKRKSFQLLARKWVGSQSERFYQVGVWTRRGSVQRSTSGEAYRFGGASVFELEQDWIIWSQRGAGMHLFKTYGGLHKELPYGSSPLSMRTRIRRRINLSWACHLCES